MIRRRLDRVWLAGWLLVLLVGLPAVLIAWVGWPLPDHRPGRAAWQQWLAQPVTRTGVVDALAVAGWLLWAVLVYALLVELLHRVGRVVRVVARLRLPRLPTPLQATASGVLGAAVFSLTTSSLTTSSPATGTPATGSLTGSAVAASGAALAAHPAGSATELAGTGGAAHRAATAGPGHRPGRPRSPWPARAPGCGCPTAGGFRTTAPRRCRPRRRWCGCAAGSGTCRGHPAGGAATTRT